MANFRINDVVNVLRGGGLVVFPTDTVYGLLVDAKNEEAVKKLIAFKARPQGRPISVFAADFDSLRQLVEVTPKDLTRLKELLPGPYTVVLKSEHIVSKLLESEKGTLGVRIPNYKAVSEVMERFAGPVTATSANRSGHPSVHTVAALMNQLNDSQKAMIDLVVDVGELPRNKPSTVIDMTTDDLKVLREGDLKFSSTKIYKSTSPEETVDIAQKIMRDTSSRGTEAISPLVFILQGDLGAGKTQFAKGVAEYLKIGERIISPTFVIYYEYKIPKSQFRNLIHMDLYNISDPEEFRYLGMDRYLDTPNIFCIEWGEKSGEIIERLNEKAIVIYIHIRHVGEKTREISLNRTS